MILIAGDSWGCSEWPNPRQPAPYPRHGCLTQYFNDAGQPVINISVGGNSNFETATILENFLENNHDLSKQIQTILVFQTGWSRDYQKKHALNIDLDQELSYSYQDIVARFVSRFYKKISDVACKHNQEIQLIGGSADTIYLDNFGKEYPGLRVVCQSMVNLVLTGQHRIQQPVLNMWVSNPANLEFITLLKKKLMGRDLEHLLEDIATGEDRQKTIATFDGDGYHLTHCEYKILFEFLQKNALHH